MGPASKEAIRKGLIEVPYDVGFVYAEVNADKVFYLRQADGSFKQYMIKKNELGKMILTKGKNTDEYEDITKEYKYEHDLTMNSLIDTEHTRMRSNENSITRKIKIEIISPSSVALTDDLNGMIIVRGVGVGMESQLKAEAFLMSYTGRNICKLYDSKEKITNSGNRYNLNERKIEFKICRDILTGSVTEEFPYIKIKVFCLDSNSDELGYAEKIISVKTPDLEISGVPDICKVGTKIRCVVSVANTLSIPLTNPTLRVKFTDDKERKIRLKNIYPGKRIAQDIIFSPRVRDFLT